MSREQTLIDLADARETVSRQLEQAREQVSRLENALAGLDTSIDFFEEGSNIPSQKGLEPLFSESTQVKKEPTAAVVEMFESNPMKEFTTPEIGQYLEKLRLRGDLKTKNRKIAKQCGYIPKRLLQDGIIDNVGLAGKPRWRYRSRSFLR